MKINRILILLGYYGKHDTKNFKPIYLGLSKTNFKNILYKEQTNPIVNHPSYTLWVYLPYNLLNLFWKFQTITDMKYFFVIVKKKGSHRLHEVAMTVSHKL